MEVTNEINSRRNISILMLLLKMQIGVLNFAMKDEKKRLGKKQVF
jgi:hypothetical protein